MPLFSSTNQPPKKVQPAIDRLLAKCIETSHGCWEFQGALDVAGYGRIGLGRREEGTALTHRVTYEYFIDSIPDGLDLDHLCRNRTCCNPWHLEPVTRVVNAARGNRGPGYGEREISRCKHGHDFTPENTYRDVRGYRQCRACMRRRDRARKARMHHATTTDLEELL